MRFSRLFDVIGRRLSSRERRPIRGQIAAVLSAASLVRSSTMACGLAAACALGAAGGPTAAQPSPDFPPALRQGAPAPAVSWIPGPSPDRPLDELLISGWTLEDGLPSNTLMNIHRGDDGYLWIATYSGLVRFDGVRFEIFDRRNHPELATNAFVEFFEDDQGILWLGTQGSGIWRIRDDRLEPFDTRRLGVVALSIDVSEAHGLLIGMDTGLFQWQGAHFEPFVVPGLGKTRVREISVDETTGAIWIASEENGLARIEDGKTTWWTEEDGLPSRTCWDLLRHDGKLWLATFGGLAVLDGQGLRSIRGLEGLELVRLYADSFGMIWIVSTAGLIRLDPKTEEFEHLRDLRGHSLRELVGLAFDDEGSVWLASGLSGLMQLQPGNFKSYTQEDGLNTARVNTAYESRDGSIWLGLDDGTGQRIPADGDPTGITDLNLPLVSEARIRHFLEDSNGRTWISSYSGLTLRQNGRDRILDARDGLPSRQIRFTFEDSRKLIWIGTRNGGLALLRDDAFESDASETGPFEVFDQSRGLPSDFILSMDETEDGRLVVGMRGGLSVLGLDDDGAVRIEETYTEKHGLPGALVFNTHPEEERIWLATDGGLGVLQNGRFQSLGPADGLPTDTFFDVQPGIPLPGNQEPRVGEDLWLTSSLGVVRLDRRSILEYLAAQERGDDESKPPPIQAVLLDHHDGLAHRQCTAATAFTRSRDGRLLFPTLGGLSIVDPTRISSNPVPPPIHIQSLDVDGREVLPTKKGLELDPGARRLVFRFSNLSLRKPHKNRLWYRLEGFDDGWIEADSQRQAVYTSLSPGRYRFRVIGTNDDGVANLEGASLDFRLRPRFYESLLFVLLSIALTPLLIQQFVAWRIRVIHRRNAELEKMVDEQRRIALEKRRLFEELETKNQELERFTYTVSHDLKSPLVTIQGFAGALRHDLEVGDNERVEQDIDLILKASQRMELLLGELLQLTRIGLVKSTPQRISMSEPASEAVQLTAGHRQATGAEIEIQAHMPVVLLDRSRMTEVFQNLIENALKFVPPNRRPKIRVGCEVRNERPTYFVEDNGVGIAPEHREQVFQLFKRLRPGDDGTGVGLAVVKRTIEGHGGRIWVESPADERQGTIFCFTLPGLKEGENSSDKANEVAKGRHPT